MAKIVLICSRVSRREIERSKLESVCRRISPEDMDVRVIDLSDDPALALIVVNPPSTLAMATGAACLGTIFGQSSGWAEVGTAAPDGCYAIYRSNAACVEILTDASGSRSVWYCQLPDVFIASTSQRAIISIMGSFRLNNSAIHWLLSSGSLGPNISWDSRISSLGAESRLVLDRAAWSITVEETPIGFDPVERPVPIWMIQLQERLATLADSLRVTMGDQWPLALSGGVDSRALAILLSRKYPLRAITWGMLDALNESQNDAHIATVLAKRLSISHHYIAMEPHKISAETILARFIELGEARADRIGGYIDGFHIWSWLRNQGIPGLIRGDESFGWIQVASERAVRRALGLDLLSDYLSDRDILRFGMTSQAWPQQFNRMAGETLETWRDRLYQRCRAPTLLAALNELKCGYIEIVNPFLSKSLIHFVRTMPDHLRTNKQLFRDFIRRIGPSVPLATSPAVPPLVDLLTGLGFREAVQRVLVSERARELMSPELLDYMLNPVPVGGHVRPQPIAGRRWPPGVLAFRGCLAVMVATMLTDDAAYFATPPILANISSKPQS